MARKITRSPGALWDDTPGHLEDLISDLRTILAKGSLVGAERADYSAAIVRAEEKLEALKGQRKAA